MAETQRPLAVVTGASSGIGEAIAHELARRGYDLIVVGRSEKLHDVAFALADEGANVTAARIDLGTHDGVEHLAAVIAEDGRDVEALILNAGKGLGDRFIDNALEDVLALLSLNVVSTTHLANRVLPTMAAAGHGRVMITASVASLVPGPYMAVYSASKAYLYSLGVALRDELKDSGVSLTILMPGPTETPIFDRAGMGKTPVGSLYPKTPVADVAREAVDGLLAGKDKVVSGGLLNKLEVTFAPFMPEFVTNQLNRALTQPGSNDKK